jgi:hypothetical protein
MDVLIVDMKESLEGLFASIAGLQGAICPRPETTNQLGS